MTFNSIEFAVFFIVFLLAYYIVVPNRRARNVLLLIGSYAFYMSWYWQYAGLIALSTLVDWTSARAMVRTTAPRVRRSWLVLSLSVNLGLLGLFKYFNFFAESVGDALSLAGIPVDMPTLSLLLPVGISFYTFQTMSYSIDVYRGQLGPERSLLRFATYVAFFPQLVAGPIVRATTFLPQLRVDVKLSGEHVRHGLLLIVIGLAKKILIADLLAYYIVDAVFDAPEAYTSVDLMIALYAYAFQIYCDFSGYSDIAIGIALMLGFRLPINFDKPYLAQSPSDFWRRWHITLSQWLRDYLYIPLGGNRGSAARVGRNLFITMLLGGLWHGAAWNFVLWGFWHGLILAATRKWTDEVQWNAHRVLKVLFTFHLILFSWLLFRVPDIDTLARYWSGLTRWDVGVSVAPLGVAILLIAAASHLLPVRTIEVFVRRPPNALLRLAYPGALAGCMLLFIGASVDSSVFVYFQF